MQPVMVMFMGTWADMRPIRTTFSPVSGWKAESYTYLALHSWSSVSPGVTMPALQRLSGNRQAILGADMPFQALPTWLRGSLGRGPGTLVPNLRIKNLLVSRRESNLPGVGGSYFYFPFNHTKRGTLVFLHKHWWSPMGQTWLGVLQGFFPWRQRGYPPTSLGLNFEPLCPCRGWPSSGMGHCREFVRHKYQGHLLNPNTLKSFGLKLCAILV